MKKFPTIEEMHQEFEMACMPPDVPKFQIVEMKKAFMAGVAAMFYVLKGDCGDPEVEDMVSVKYMSSIEDELITFFSKEALVALNKEAE